MATEGTESTYTSGGVTYKVHIFTTNGNFIVTNGGANVEYLIVGGAGGQSGTAGNGASGIVIIRYAI